MGDRTIGRPQSTSIGRYHVILQWAVFCSAKCRAQRPQEKPLPDRTDIYIEKEGKMPYLKYTEDVAKNRQGGMESKRVIAKEVLHHANTQNPSRCFVRLLALYLSHCPEDSPPECFFQQPLLKPTSIVWYSKQAIGHYQLQSVVQRIWTAAGITDYKTNHSLRATSATRLFHHNVDEQLIMEKPAIVARMGSVVTSVHQKRRHI